MKLRMFASVFVVACAALPLNGAQMAASAALSFDGTDDRVLIAGGTPVALPWTAEFWINRQPAFHNSAILLGDAFTALKLEQFNGTGRVGFTQFGVADYTYTYTFPVGVWTHLAFVATGSYTMLYVNGALQEVYPATVALPRGQIGGDIFNRYANHFRGALSEVRLWNTARSEAQIQANLNRPLDSPQPNLVAYWRLNEGAGTTVADASGQGLTGSLSQGPAWIPSTIPFVPGAATELPTAITTTTAVLNGTANPNNAFTFVWFEWGTNTNYGNITSRNSAGSGNSLVSFQAPVNGLTLGATYHYRAAASNQFGLTLAADQTFRPAFAPFTMGRLVCVDGRPLSNAWVTVELHAGGSVRSATNLTDAGGAFAAVLNCAPFTPPAEFVVHSTACPSEEWSFPTALCYGNLGTLVCRQCTPSTRPPPTTILWLPFDERPGPVAVNVAGGNNGTLFQSNAIAVSTPMSLRGPGRVGTALYLDGVDGHVDVPAYPEVEIGTNDFSIVAWIQPFTNETRVRVVAESLLEYNRPPGGLIGYSLRFVNIIQTNQIALLLANGTNSTTFPAGFAVPADGRWHHLAVTIQRQATNGVHFYLDGVADVAGQDPTAYRSPLGSGPGPVRIGASQLTPSAGFGGALDEMAVFRRSLAPKEIRSLLRAGEQGMDQAKACPARTFAADIPSVCCGAPGQRAAGGPTPTTTATASFQVCNQSTTAKSYCVSFQAGGPAPLPTGCITPGQCQTLTVMASVPYAGGVTKLTYYTTEGDCSSSSSSSPPTTAQPCSLCLSVQTNASVRMTAEAHAGGGAFGAGGGATDVTFVLTNPFAASVLYSYRVTVVNPNLVPVNAVELTGNTNGAFLALFAGGAATIAVTARFMMPDPLVAYAVLLEVNWDDGQGWQPWISTDLENPLTPTCQAQITQHPASVFVSPGASVTLSVAATSAQPPLSYRWRKNRIPLGANAGGATYTIAAVAPGDEALYDVVVMDGCGAVLSHPAWVLLSDKVRLAITREGDRVELSWPERLNGFELQTAATLPASPTTWIRVAQAPVSEGGAYRVRLTRPVFSMNSAFFRLARTQPTAGASDCD
jgi:hypothetical protein